jgi:hypothetical protein
LILYVNGDSHSAGAEAVNSFAFANDDPQYKYLGRVPHPDNLFVSYGNILAKNLLAELYCDAESASSNDRIIRTTKHYLKNNRPDLIVIGWSTWEREEWLYEGQYWQINAGGVSNDWPDAIKQQYKHWVTNIDHKQKQREAQEKIYQLHQELADISHLFFNTYSSLKLAHKIDWQLNYLDPYDDSQTYYNWLKDKNIKTVNPNNYHFGPDGHQIWADHLTKMIKESIMVK